METKGENQDGVWVSALTSLNGRRRRRGVSLMSMTILLAVVLTASDTCRIRGASAHILMANLTSFPGVVPSSFGQAFCRFSNDSLLPAEAMRKQFCCNVSLPGGPSVTQINLYNATLDGPNVTLSTNGTFMSLIGVNASAGPNGPFTADFPVEIGCAHNISMDVYHNVHENVESVFLAVSTTINVTGALGGMMFDAPSNISVSSTGMNGTNTTTGSTTHQHVPGMDMGSSSADSMAMNSSDANHDHSQMTGGSLDPNHDHSLMTPGHKSTAVIDAVVSSSTIIFFIVLVLILSTWLV